MLNEHIKTIYICDIYNKQTLRWMLISHLRGKMIFLSLTTLEGQTNEKAIKRNQGYILGEIGKFKYFKAKKGIVDFNKVK